MSFSHPKAAWGQESEIVAAFLMDAGFRPGRHRNIELKASSPRLGVLLGHVEKNLKASGLKLMWHVSEPEPPTPVKCGWFDPLMGGAEADDALKLRSGLHFGWIRHDESTRYAYAYVASDAFLVTVKKHRLRGLASLPLPPAGRKVQTGWWQVFAREPIGRGLDHPVADGARVVAGRKSEYGRSLGWRWGHPTPGSDDADPARVNHSEIRRLFRLGKGMFHAPQRYVREHLPKSDFAYNGWYQDVYELHRDRGILFSQRAMEVLVKARMLRATHVRPVQIVLAADADQPILDTTIKHPLPPPSYTDAEAVTEERRRLQLVQGLNPPKPTKAPRTTAAAAKVLLRLSRTKHLRHAKQDSVLFARIQRSALFARLPSNWKTLLPGLPLEVEDSEGTAWILRVPQRPPRDVVAEWKRQPSDDRSSASDIVIAETSCGDWYAIRENDPRQPRDARVRLWSHETHSIAQEWPSVLALVSYLDRLARER